ncbi:putative methyltransferase-domain-containing protein [Hysterangium stoloniferum]|nr:putative methyltransferase-domain-containing protein [Hysterangium stoloniferum]
MEHNFPDALSIQGSDSLSWLRKFTGSEDLEQLSQVSVWDEQGVVASQTSDIKAFGIAGRIWEATYIMTLYLRSPHYMDFDPPCSISTNYHRGAIVELGAGTGYIGLSIASILSSNGLFKSPKTLALTDLSDVCHLLERNCRKKISTEASYVNLVIQPLEWGNMGHGQQMAYTLSGVVKSETLVSHIICSDLVYFPELFGPLLRSLIQLSSPPFASKKQPVEIIISYMIRSLPKETPFWSAFGLWFDFAPVLVRQRASEQWTRYGDNQDVNCFIFIARRKTESLAWTIPDDDIILKKGNDAFETLLLMSLPSNEK